MIPKISPQQNKPVFTSVYIAIQTEGDKPLIKKISSESEADWLKKFITSSKENPPKHIMSIRGMHKFVTKNEEEILITENLGTDFIRIISKDGKSLVTALNDYVLTSMAEPIKTIQSSFEELSKIFKYK